MKFKAAELDKTAKLATGFIFILLLGFLCLTIFGLLNANSDMVKGTGLAFVIILLVIIGTYITSPSSYTIIEGNIVIKLNSSREIKIPFRETKKIEPIKEERTLKVFGNGGLFGYTGTFRARNTGLHQRWVTDRSKMILIETIHKKYIISPKDPQSFIQICHDYMPEIESSEKTSQ